MKQSVYLHRPIYEILSCYGELDDVVNKILEEAAQGKFDVMNKPACPGREGASRYDINITEPNYIELLCSYSPCSSRISIRRLIYWFVENEIYAELGWTPTREYVNRNQRIFTNKINNASSELQRARSYCNDDTIKDKLIAICKEIDALKEKTL